MSAKYNNNHPPALSCRRLSRSLLPKVAGTIDDVSLLILVLLVDVEVAWWNSILANKMVATVTLNTSRIALAFVKD